MQHRTGRTFLGAAGLIVLLAACSSSRDASDPFAASGLAAKSPAQRLTPSAIPKRTPVDPKVAAQRASGLSPAQYAQLGDRVSGLDIHVPSAQYDQELAAIANTVGPDVVIAYGNQISCAGDSSGKKYWEIAGELSSGHTCGEESWEQSEAAAIAKVREKVTGDINYEHKRIVVIVQ